MTVEPLTAGRPATTEAPAPSVTVTAAKLEQNGYMVVGSAPEQLATLLKSEIDKWSSVVTETGIKID